MTLSLPVCLTTAPLQATVFRGVVPKIVRVFSLGLNVTVRANFSWRA